MTLWMHTRGGNHLSKRRRIAKRKKAALAWLREQFGRTIATSGKEKA